MKWATHPPSEVNHAPVPVIGNDKSNKVIYERVVPGKTITMNASTSTDKDGDQLSYRWFHYVEASTYDDVVEIKDPANPILNFKVPKDLDDKEIHLVLEVRDNGLPSLVAYRRIVIQQK